MALENKKQPSGIYTSGQLHLLPHSTRHIVHCMRDTACVTHAGHGSSGSLSLNYIVRRADVQMPTSVRNRPTVAVLIASPNTRKPAALRRKRGTALFAASNESRRRQKPLRIVAGASLNLCVTIAGAMRTENNAAAPNNPWKRSVQVRRTSPKSSRA